MRPDPTERYDSLIKYWWLFSADPLDHSADWRLAKEVVRQESNFIASAVSSANARGLMQLEKPTWGDDADYDRSWINPEQNLRHGIGHMWYLWSLFKKEQGLERWKMALGSYNAGQGNIFKCQTKLGNDGIRSDLWDNIVSVLPSVTGADSAETIDYVSRIMSRYLALGGS